jgi:hypothetical protein
MQRGDEVMVRKLMTQVADFESNAFLQLLYPYRDMVLCHSNKSRMVQQGVGGNQQFTNLVSVFEEPRPT